MSMERRNVCGVEVEVAKSLPERIRGLIGRTRPAPGTGMLIMHCNCIHTCFMGYPIDATFIDHDGRPVKIVRGIRPWRLWVWGGWRAVAVLETAAIDGSEFGIISK